MQKITAYTCPKYTYAHYSPCIRTMGQLQKLHTHIEREEKRDILLKGVEREWKVKKHASRFCRVGPVGILYMGYLHQEFAQQISQINI